MPYQNFVGANSLLDVVNAGLLSALHGVVALETADVHQEVLQHGLPILCEVHLRVKLHPVQFLVVIANTCTGGKNKQLINAFLNSSVIQMCSL